ncbi:hypothetical protein OH76DRAFT_1417352 [Lentinus brumalis]|uniref:DUF5648 domain-containing protein n=1 Tax=Lentinus brumalis TaxID=2498619 RepID=A0A371DFH5_9APHY|nr:hypothetical protein OH76DRAFT_1417352 [Polyporus brumalis]
MKFLAAIVAAVLFSQAGALPAPEPSAALKLEALSAAARPTAAAVEAVASAALIEARTAAARLSAAVALSAAVGPTAAVIDAVASAAAVEARSAAARPSAAVEFEALSAAVRATAAAVATQAVDVRDAHEARAVNACGYAVVPLYRAVSDSLSDRIFTTDASEVEAALASKTYVRSAILAAVYSNTTGSSVPGAVPLYRLYSAAKTDHFITTSWDEVETAVGGNGYEYQGITAYVYPEAECGAVPFYRQYNPSIEDHFYSTTKPESAKSSTTGVDGWFYEGITGYVFPPQ